jgi:DNA-binding protein H-NS
VGKIQPPFKMANIMNSPMQNFPMSANSSRPKDDISNLGKPAGDSKKIQRKIKKNKEEVIHEVVAIFLKSLKANLLTLEDVKPLLFPGLQQNVEAPMVEPRSGPASKSRLKSGTVYQDPNSSETWTAGGKGARPKWIQMLLRDSVDISSLVLIDSPQS